MKKLAIFTFALLGIFSMAKAQTVSKTFEGEIHLTNFANFCDYINDHGVMPGGNGTHKQTLVLKGDKGKLVDHTAGSTTVWDMSTGEYITFIEELKKGLYYKNNIDAVLTLAPRDIKIYGNQLQKVSSNTIAPTGHTETINGHDCMEIKGTLVREQGGIQSKYGIKIYCDTTIAVPNGYIAAVYGLELPGLPVKWTYSYDGGHVPMIGELSAYLETTIDDYVVREVADDEFKRPSSEKPKRGKPVDPNVLEGYKVTSTSNPMSMLGYLKEANKYAKKRIEADRAAGNQSDYDSFQTSGEWDF